MAPYIALFALIIVGGLLLSYFQYVTRDPLLKNRLKLFYCLAIGLALICVCGLRDTSVGFSDNEAYAKMFYVQHYYSLSTIWDSIVHPEEYDYRTRDLTYHVVNVFLAQFFNHHQYCFFFWAIVSLSGFIWLIYRY